MSQAQHHDLAQGRWQNMTLAEQLGNVGSEYSRARKWKEQGNEQFFGKAFSRLLELLDLTITDNRWHGPRRRELTRVRSGVCEELLGREAAGMSFNKYFDVMAVAARR
ncbi:MAG: hypothetical protein WCV85_02940 [Patescibacteria group bacterium]|jgi:hypothetical protein